MRSVTQGLFWVGVCLLCLACNAGSALPDGDEDRPPADGDRPWPDGDTPDGDPVDPPDGDQDNEEGGCDPAVDDDYCEGSWRVYCNPSTRLWESRNCAPETCRVFGRVAACVPGEDGDLDEEHEPDLDPPDGDHDPESDGDTDQEGEEEAEGDDEADPVVHICDASNVFFGPPCADHQDCGDFCEPKVGQGCWECGLDAVCSPAEEGTGSCFAGDPDPEVEEEIPWECSELDRWTCSGNFLVYCQGGFWAQLNCALSGQTCQLTESAAECGGTAVDGDEDGEDDPCVVDPTLDGPALAVDTSELVFSNLPREILTIRQLQVCNIGAEPLHVSSVHLEGFGLSPFSVLPPDGGLPLVLASGESAGLGIALRPMSAGPHQAAVRVAADDPEQPVIRVPLTATTAPLGRLSTFPAATLRFTTGGSNSKVLQVKNTGDIPLTLSIPEFVNDGGHYYPSAGDITGILTVGQTKTYTITHSGVHRVASLVIPWTCTGCGDQSTTIALTTVTGNDCPLTDPLPDRDVYPMTTIQLDASSSQNPDGTLLEYRWTWDARPPIAVASDFLNAVLDVVTGVWGSTATPTVWLDQPGTYTPRMTLRDDGATGCDGVNNATATLSVAPLSALYVSVTVASGGGDHDLYLVRPGGNGLLDSPANTDVCYQGNCHTARHTAADCPARGCPGPANAPDWGVIGVRGDDPMLITASTGRGPEALMLDVLETGNYTVLVANIAGGTTTNYTVQVWTYGVLRNEFTTTITQGNCHYEQVATLAVSSDKSVTVTPVRSIHAGGCR